MKRWQEVMKFILDYHRVHKLYPRQVDVEKSLGFKSRQAVHEHWNYLKKNGHIKVDKKGLIKEILKR